MGRNWTEAQKQCIEITGGSLVVSAAAGSGKTSVLVERVSNLITNPVSPIDVDRLLVVTFTKAAAAEMKHRLTLSIAEKLRENPYDIRLQRQQLLLPSAQISTVHSFCLNLIKENFQALNLSPNIKIGEDNHMNILRQDSLERVLEARYASYSSGAEGGDFQKLSALIGGDKNDKRLFETILKIYNFLTAQPFPNRWMDRVLSLFSCEAEDSQLPLTETVWGKVILEHITEEIRGGGAVLNSVINLAARDSFMAEKVIPIIESDIIFLHELADSFENAALLGLSWDNLRDKLSAVKKGFGRMAYPKGDDLDAELKRQIGKVRDGLKDDLASLVTSMCSSEEQFRQDKEESYRILKVLFDIIKDFSADYKAKKLELNVVDFADLEHYCLELLVDENGHKTEIAKSVSAGFDEILVDEYQDTNGAQEALFSALSKDETNLFTVGDVKQSIYGFRNAMPSIFIERRKKSPPFDKTSPSFPATITLGNNFRSRFEVTDIVNFVFEQIMRQEVGGIDYDQNEKLVASADYFTPPASKADEYATEFILIEDTERDQEEDKNEVEAAIIAREIKNIVGKLDIKDGETIRKVAYGDISILLRSKNVSDTAYLKGLMENGVPAWSESRSGFFGSPEIAVALSMLRVIENPTLDIPLLSYVMSPLVGFTPDDMAEIRIYDRKRSIYSAMTRYVKEGENLELKGKIALEFERLNSWRGLAVTMQADKFIHRVYEESLIIPIYSAMANGEQRRANLRLLHEKARQYEKSEFRGLSAFIRHINKMISQGVDFAPAAVAGKVNAVSILSIHNSKGLEYPVVFLAGLGKSFNKTDLKGKLLFESEIGVGIKLRDFEALTERDTVPRRAVRQLVDKNIVAEELRVLYVAMTRAKEKLFLVMTVKNLENTISKLAVNVGGAESRSANPGLGHDSPPSTYDSLTNLNPRLPAGFIASVAGMGGWLLAALLRHPNGAPLREMGGIDVDVLPCSAPLAIKLVGAGRDNDSAPQEESTEIFEDVIAESCGDSAVVDEGMKEEIIRRIHFEYPYSHISQIPAKLAASGYAKKMTDSRAFAASRPAFLGEKGLTPAERGTALHTFMQFADYNKASGNVAEEIARLERFGFLSPEQAVAINRRKVENFFKSDLYSRIARLPKEKVFREVEFFYEITAEEYLASQGEGQPAPILQALEDSVVVQGIADCLLIEDNMLTIIDYKTDSVKEAGVLAHRYLSQLKIYAKALTFMFELPVHECLLYAFALDKTIALDF